MVKKKFIDCMKKGMTLLESIFLMMLARKDKDFKQSLKSIHLTISYAGLQDILRRNE